MPFFRCIVAEPLTTVPGFIFGRTDFGVVSSATIKGLSTLFMLSLMSTVETSSAAIWLMSGPASVSSAVGSLGAKPVPVEVPVPQPPSPPPLCIPPLSVLCQLDTAPPPPPPPPPHAARLKARIMAVKAIKSFVRLLYCLLLVACCLLFAVCCLLFA